MFGQLRTPISLNRYTYGYANPLGFWDPDGRQSLFLEEAIEGRWGSAEAARDYEPVQQTDAQAAARDALNAQTKAAEEELAMQDAYVDMVSESVRVSDWGIDASSPEELYVAEHEKQMRIALVTMLSHAAGYSDVLSHINVSGEGCIWGCIGVSFQGGTVFVEFGSAGFGASGSIGLSSATKEEKLSLPGYGNGTELIRLWGGPVGWESGRRQDGGWYQEGSVGIGGGFRAGPGLSVPWFSIW